MDGLVGPGPHAVTADGRYLVVVRTPSGLRAFQGHCPHRGELLGEGELDGDTLICRNHRWQFRTSDRRRIGSPPDAIREQFTFTMNPVGLEILVSPRDGAPASPVDIK